MAAYLVTGGAGFIGSHIAAMLVEQGEQVRVLDDLTTGFRRNIERLGEGVEFMEGDILDVETCQYAVRGMDYVIHQAALASVPRSVEEPLASHAVNATGTVNLLEAARDAKVKRFVYAGSSSAYGNREIDYTHEDLAPQPLSPYASSKLAGEHYVRAFSECYGLEGVVLRYFNVFGPRQDPNSPYSAVIPIFVKALLEGRPPTIHGDGEQSRDFTYVTNNAKANLLAATADIEAKGQVYNIACGTSCSVIAMYRKLSELLEVDLEPHFTEPRVGDVRMSRAHIALAQRDLGYDVEVDFDEGLRRTVDWYREEYRQGRGL